MMKRGSGQSYGVVLKVVVMWGSEGREMIVLSKVKWITWTGGTKGPCLLHLESFVEKGLYWNIRFRYLDV